MAAKPKIRPYRPIEKQPRTALFQRHPNVTEALGEYQEALRSLKGNAEAITQLEFLRQQTNRAFAIANEEMEGQFRLSPDTRVRYINRGTKGLAEMDFLSVGPEINPGTKTPEEVRENVRKVLHDETQAISIAQQDAIEGRPLTQQWIKDMHGLLTRNQPYARAVAQVEGLGAQDGVVPLRSGDYKRVDNDVLLLDGSIQQYCPMGPMVIEEMERLLVMHRENLAQGTPPEAEAAWMMRQLKHIHPFQDGNSRTSRVLMCFILLRHMMPAVMLHPGHDGLILDDTMFEASQNKNWKPLIEFIRSKVIQKLELDTRQINRAVRGENIVSPNGNGIQRNGDMVGPRLD
ncbi:MAG: Fic family protein [Deltaproteobacteria bacterium]|nr:Fic family protein [Deltaproteobacteria bacterium]